MNYNRTIRLLERALNELKTETTFDKSWQKDEVKNGMKAIRSLIGTVYRLRDGLC